MVAPIASAAEPEDGNQRNPREVAIKNVLERRNPQVLASGGFFAVSSNDDGTFSIDCMGTMDLMSSKSVVDISPLGGVPLRTANFWKMPIRDLTSECFSSRGQLDRRVGQGRFHGQLESVTSQGAAEFGCLRRLPHPREPGCGVDPLRGRGGGAVGSR